jgi:hypothetical protein
VLKASSRYQNPRNKFPVSRSRKPISSVSKLCALTIGMPHGHSAQGVRGRLTGPKERKSLAMAVSASLAFEGSSCAKQLCLTLTPPGDKFVTRTADNGGQPVKAACWRSSPSTCTYALLLKGLLALIEGSSLDRTQLSPALPTNGPQPATLRFMGTRASHRCDPGVRLCPQLRRRPAAA